MSYLRLKKDNYLAIIPLTEEKKMVEIEAKDEDSVYKIACEYATKYCKRHGCLYVNPVIVKIPDCITVIG